MLPLFAALAAAQFIEGASSSASNSAALDRLHRQDYPLLSESPEQKQARLASQEMAKRGFSVQEASAHNQQLARSENTGYMKSLDTAPGLAGAVLAGANYANIGAINDFAVKDASLHRQNIQYADKLTQNYQNMLNANIASQQRNRIMAEQALGKAVSDSKNRMMSAGNTLIAGQGMGGGMGGRMKPPVGGVTASMGSKLYSTPADAPVLQPYPMGGLPETQIPIGDYTQRNGYDWHTLTPDMRGWGADMTPYRKPTIPYEDYNNLAGQ